MRKLSLLAGGVATAGLLVLAAAGTADAQSRRGGPMAEGPAHPCRPALMQFDNALSRMMGPQMAEGGMHADATRMRNEGMQACMAGRVEEGRRMIQQAAQGLRG